MCDEEPLLLCISISLLAVYKKQPKCAACTVYQYSYNVHIDAGQLQTVTSKHINNLICLHVCYISCFVHHNKK